MNTRDKLANRIKYLCKKNNISYYSLSYKSTVPITTLMHIVNATTKNPGIFTIIKICNGLDITIRDFFDSEEFENIEYETE